MRLYIVRHGDAVHPAEDPARPLSALGRDDIGRLGAWMAARGVEAAEILHSPKLRAKETAEILARALRPASSVREVSGLLPNDPPQEAADLLRFEAAPVLAVSHLPLVEYLVGRLLAGNPARGRLTFRPGTAAALTGGGDDWALDWLVHPDMV